MRRHDLVPQHSVQSLAPDPFLSAQAMSIERSAVGGLARLQNAFVIASVGMYNTTALSQKADESFRRSPMNESGYRAIVEAYNMVAVSELHAFAVQGRS
jgi:hypothetical protein